jgi:hypothetical protein
MSSPVMDEAGRQEYLRYLEENQLSEEKVLPIVPSSLKNKPEVTGKLLAALQSGHIDLVRRVQEAMTGNTNLLLSAMNQQLCARFTRSNIAVPTNAFVGVFPTNCFNAHVVRRTTKNLVLINTGAFELIESIMSVFASLDAGTAGTQAATAARFLTNYCENRSLPSEQDLAELRLSPDRVELATQLTTSIEEFILSHEYGHLANKHIGDAQATVTVDATRAIRVVSKTKEQEFEADLWAADALVRVCPTSNEESLLFACCGPLMFLSISALIEAYYERKGLKFDTHPPAYERYLEIKNALAKAGMRRYLGTASTFHQFCILIARHLTVNFREQQGELMVIDHVGSLVDEGLQEPVPIFKQRSRIFAPSPEMPVKKRWWQK